MLNESLANLKGETRALTIDEEGKTLGGAGEICKFVKIINRNTDDDLDLTYNTPTDTAAVKTCEGEIYFGYQGLAAHAVFPGEETDFFPCQNLSQILVKTRKNKGRTIYFTFFV